MAPWNFDPLPASFFFSLFQTTSVWEQRDPLKLTLVIFWIKGNLFFEETPKSCLQRDKYRQVTHWFTFVLKPSWSGCVEWQQWWGWAVYHLLWHYARGQSEFERSSIPQLISCRVSWYAHGKHPWHPCSLPGTAVSITAFNFLVHHDWLLEQEVLRVCLYSYLLSDDCGH